MAAKAKSGWELARRGLCRAAVGSMVELWFHTGRPRWGGEGWHRVGSLHPDVWLSFLMGSWLPCCPCPSGFLSSLSCTKMDVSLRNLYQETKRKETKAGRVGRNVDMASKQNTQVSVLR